MKNKLLYIFTLAILSVASFFIGRHIMHKSAPISTSTANLNIEASETARIGLNGYELKILTNTYFFNRNFIFLDNKTGDIVTTLSITNPARGLPYYRIVKGHTRDWLVVTKVETWGTGLQFNDDEWYTLGSSGSMEIVLSYQSEGNEVASTSDKNKHWRTDIINESSLDDSAVDVKFTEKDCSATEDGSDKDCSESSHMSHYVWDVNKEEFVLKK